MFNSKNTRLACIRASRVSHVKVASSSRKLASPILTRCTSSFSHIGKISLPSNRQFSPDTPFMIRRATSNLLDTTAYTSQLLRLTSPHSTTRGYKSSASSSKPGRKGASAAGATRAKKYSRAEDYTGKPKESRNGKTFSPAALQKELQWIGRDPVALSKRAKKLLQYDNYEQAIDLVKAAEATGLDCIVSWNIIFAHLGDRQMALDALKLFNDMKKRGRIPNSQTFTVLFAGLARAKERKCIERAVALYESMKSANSPIKPNIQHTNGVVTVFARHLDMKGLWEFVGQLPEYGDCAPDHTTFTIILNSMTTSLTKGLGPTTKPVELTRLKSTAVVDAKKIWIEVMNLWRGGKLTIDQKLVFAMVRFLSQTEEQGAAFHEIFAIFNRCMGIPLTDWIQTGIDNHRVSSENGDKTRGPEADDEGEIPSKQTQQEQVETNKLFWASILEPIDLEKIHTTAQAKRKGDMPEQQQHQQLALPSPSNAELTLLLELFQQVPTHVTFIARDYWSKLTSKDGLYKIEPDAVSYHEYLRILRRQRAGLESLRLIRDEMVPKGFAGRKTFIIALSTCSRDRNNPRTLDTAGELLDLSSASLAVPDSRLTSEYFELIQIVLNPKRLASGTVPQARTAEQSSPNQSELRSRLIQSLQHFKLQAQDVTYVLAYGRKPMSQFKRSNEEDKPDSSAKFDMEEEVIVKLALQNLSEGSRSRALPLTEYPAEAIRDCMTILWQEYKLLQMLLGPQLGTVVTGSERDQYTKHYELLKRFYPFFKKLEIKQEHDQSNAGNRERPFVQQSN
ncbi:hypothetical protein FQN57_003077 [Myotisia sp. PD_48]|nr:hypothetical protein FQN57_003077 [Myotisia sp. PD_48]